MQRVGWMLGLAVERLGLMRRACDLFSSINVSIFNFKDSVEVMSDPYSDSSSCHGKHLIFVTLGGLLQESDTGNRHARRTGRSCRLLLRVLFVGCYAPSRGLFQPVSPHEITWGVKHGRFGLSGGRAYAAISR